MRQLSMRRGTGTFWTGAGLGLSWPGDDFSLLGLVAAFLIVGLLAIPFARPKTVHLAAESGEQKP